MIKASAPELEIFVEIPRVARWRMRVALLLLKVMKWVWPAPCDMTVTVEEKD